MISHSILQTWLALFCLSLSDPLATTVLDKAMERAILSPISYKIDITRFQSQEDRFTLHANLAFQNLSHFHMEGLINITKSGQEQNARIVMVADGKSFWQEQEIPAQSIHFVRKSNLDKVPQMAKGLSPEDFRPDRFIKALQTLDITITGSKGSYTLATGLATREFLDSLTGTNANMRDVTGSPVELEWHTQNIFPLTFTLYEKETPFWITTISHLEKLTTKELDDRLAYSPPEGARFVDDTNTPK